MRKTIRKWFWAWDFEKEEKWLNEMAAKGLALVGVGFCKYEFDAEMNGSLIPVGGIEPVNISYHIKKSGLYFHSSYL